MGNGETGGAHDEVKCVLIIAVAPINPPAAFGPGGGAHTMYDASGCIGGVGVTSNTGGEYAAAFKYVSALGSPITRSPNRMVLLVPSVIARIVIPD